CSPAISTMKSVSACGSASTPSTWSHSHEPDLTTGGTLMLLACLGNDIPLDSVVTLFEDADETLVPGFGLSWFAPDDLPAAYRSGQPAILDSNLEGLARTLFSDCWLAQSGFGLGTAAPQPLFDDDIMVLVAFDPADWPAIRAIVRENLDPEIEATLDHTDPGAGIFALLRHLLIADAD